MPAKKAPLQRLIAKVFQADPLTCRQCGGKLKIVPYLHDQVAIPPNPRSPGTQPA